ncbi:alpha/beta fold hydrolase [Noviherbaspirillum sp. CPCC 100848]|uniref:Alpha/beta fold hydrolase n=1 Tax=Noviherbaspirillum album TaxID=3080276 RepID=A0ABU6J2N0_9BURK|nr:alpha/beta fold hydrolase [Noviherbaspirillum sp. CPCC 100848]MEC4717763.1 alpha/beta fold hydrolase [Noviherbaspirillum sp. CPCC 100848]
MTTVSTRHERIQGDGVFLHVEISGEGPPVILLHGFPENCHVWRFQIEPLVAAGFSVWAPNLRGYPPSDVPSRREDYHLRHLVKDVALIVKATGYPRAVVAGHDWGGVIAWTFAGAYPELLDRLIILNAPHMQVYAEKALRTSQAVRSLYAAFFQLPLLPERLLAARRFLVVRQMFKTMPYRKPAFDDEEIDDFVHTLSQPGALKAALDYYRINARPGAMALARHAKTDAPVLVIWGEKDPSLGSFLLEGLQRFAPRIRIQLLRDAGHWAPNEAPAEVNRLLLKFLSEARRRSAPA